MPDPLAAENSRTNYAEIGLTGHYSTSHHGNNPENLKKYSKLNRYNVQMFAEFVTDLLEGQSRRLTTRTANRAVRP